MHKRKILTACVSSALLAMASGSVQAAGEIRLDGNTNATDAPYSWNETADNSRDGVTILNSAVIYIEDGDDLNAVKIDDGADGDTLTLATEVGINANGTHAVYLDSITRPDPDGIGGSDAASAANLLITTTTDSFDGGEHLLLDVNGDVDLGSGALQIRSNDANATSNETTVLIAGDLTASNTILDTATANGGEATDVVLQFDGSTSQTVAGTIDGGSDFEGVVNVDNGSSTVTFTGAIGATKDVNQVNVSNGQGSESDPKAEFEQSVNAKEITVAGRGDDYFHDSSFDPVPDTSDPDFDHAHYDQAAAHFQGTVTADTGGITLLNSDTEFEDNVTVNNAGNLTSRNSDVTLDGASHAIAGDVTLTAGSVVNFTDTQGATTVGGSTLIDASSDVYISNTLAVDGSLDVTDAGTFVSFENDVTVGTAAASNLTIDDSAEANFTDTEGTVKVYGNLLVVDAVDTDADANAVAVEFASKRVDVDVNLTLSNSRVDFTHDTGATTVGGAALIDQDSVVDMDNSLLVETGNLTVTDTLTSLDVNNTVTVSQGDVLVKLGAELDVEGAFKATAGSLTLTNAGSVGTFQNDATVGADLTVSDAAEGHFTGAGSTVTVGGNLLVSDSGDTDFAGYLNAITGNLTLSNSLVDFTNGVGATTVGVAALIDQDSVVGMDNSLLVATGNLTVTDTLTSLDVNNTVTVSQGDVLVELGAELDVEGAFEATAGSLTLTNAGSVGTFQNNATVGADLTVSDAAEGHFTGAGSTVTVGGNLLVSDSGDTDFAGYLNAITGNLTLSNSLVDFTNGVGATTVGVAALIDQDSVVGMDNSLLVATGNLTVTDTLTSLDVNNTVTVSQGDVLVKLGAELDVEGAFKATAGSLTLTNAGSFGTFQNDVTVGANLIVSDAAEGYFTGAGSTVIVGGKLEVSDSEDTYFAGDLNAITGNLTLSNSTVGFINETGATTVGGAALIDQGSVVDMDNSLLVATGNLTLTDALTSLDATNTVTVSQGDALVELGAELDVEGAFEATAGSLTVTNSGSVGTFQNNVTVGADLIVSDAAEGHFTGAGSTVIVGGKLEVSDSEDTYFAGDLNAITGNLTLSNSNVEFTNTTGATTVGGAALIDGASDVSFDTTLDVTGALTIADTGTQADFNKDVIAASIAINGATATFAEDVTGAIHLTDGGAVATAVFSDDDNTINNAITVAGDGQGKIQVVDTANSSAATFSKSIGAEGLALGLLDADGADVVLMADVYANAVQVRGSATDAATLELDAAGSLNLGGVGLSIDSTAGSDASATLKGDFSGAVSMGASTGTLADLDLDNAESVITGDLLVTDSTGTVNIDVGGNAYTTFKGHIGSQGNAVDNISIAGSVASDAFTQFAADKNIYANAFTIATDAKAVMPHNTIIGTTFSNAGFLRVEDTLTFAGEMTVELANDAGNGAVLDFTGVENFSDDTVISANGSVVNISNGMTVQFDEWLNYGKYVLIDENLDVTEDEVANISISAPDVQLANYELSIVDGNLQLNWFQKDAAELAAENQGDFTKNDNRSNDEDSDALLIAATINESDEGRDSDKNSVDGTFEDALREQLLAGNTAAAAEQLVNSRAAMDGTQQALTGTMLATNNQITNRLAGVSGRGFSSGDAFVSKSVWIKPFVSTGEKESNASFAGFETDTSGLLLGMDGNPTDNTTVGLALGYYQTDIDANDVATSSSEIEGYQLGLYGAYNAATWYLNGYAGYASNAVDTRRTVSFMGGTAASASYDTDQYSLNVSAGRPYAVGNNSTLTPSVGMNYTHLTPDSYTETGLSGYSLNVDQNDTDIALLSLGLAYNTEIERGDSRFIPEVRINAMYDVIGDEVQSTSRYTGGGADFTVTGADVEELSFGLGLGLTYETGDVSVTASYDAELKDEYTGHAGSIELRYGF